MIALVTRGADDTPLAIHRTFLARDGAGKAPIDPQKMMLGPCRGGTVRLAEPGEVLMVGEGIETCLAAVQATGHAAWAALSTSGLRSLDLPKDVRDVIVLADGDDAGEAAAHDCALRWKREGRRVRIARPPRGHGLQRLLLGRAPRIEEGVDMTTDNEELIAEVIDGAEEFANHPRPKSGVKSLGCWSRAAVPIKRSRRCETTLLAPVVFTTAVFRSALPSTRSSAERSRR